MSNVDRIKWRKSPTGAYLASGASWDASVHRAAGAGWEASITWDDGAADRWPFCHEGITGADPTACKAWVRRVLNRGRW